jgi:hypothetical protein
MDEMKMRMAFAIVYMIVLCKCWRAPTNTRRWQLAFFALNLLLMLRVAGEFVQHIVSSVR